MALTLWFILCCCILCYGCMLAFVVFDFLFQYLAKSLAGNIVSEMTKFESGRT